MELQATVNCVSVESLATTLQQADIVCGNEHPPEEWGSHDIYARLDSGESETENTKISPGSTEGGRFAPRLPESFRQLILFLKQFCQWCINLVVARTYGVSRMAGKNMALISIGGHLPLGTEVALFAR
mmetsp:Transcript_3681/g.5223  ORF Transcript_3681/g.5223 Transcript_3681/m.5223 type:complete len:128 (-) Transcript_3681:9-392(-)